MNYEKIYNDLIQNIAFKNRRKIDKTDPNYIYYENHHILPKCLGGDNSKENLILLTAREHFLAHKLLLEMFPKNEKLKYAVYKMAKKFKKLKYKNFKPYLVNKINPNKNRERFIMIYLDKIDELFKLNGEVEFKLLLYLFKIVEWDNQEIFIDRQVKEEISKNIKSNIQSISDALSRLNKKGFLLKNNKYRMRYSLNPKYFYKGSISERNKTIKS